MFVKVCGLKNIEQIDWAIELGYDAIGVVVYKGSKRYVGESAASDILNYSSGKIKSVVVSMTFEDVAPYIDKCDYYQIYDSVNIDNEKFIFATDSERDFSFCKYIIYDSSKGSGVYTGFPKWLNKYKDKLIIAGGLNINNVVQTLSEITPFGIDISSGVEGKNGKDFYLMKKFIEKVRKGEEH